MNCLWCDEPIEERDRHPDAREPFHFACFFRSVAGSVAHLEGRTKVEGLRQLIAVLGGSPLQALHAMWKCRYEAAPSHFSQLITARLQEDLELKTMYTTATGY